LGRSCFELGQVSGIPLPPSVTIFHRLFKAAVAT